MVSATRARPARLLIVDDHELVRSSLNTLLSAQEGLEIVGQARNGQEALEMCRRVRPDLVLMDVRMPGMDGLAATRSIKRQLSEVSVLILTTYESEDYLLEAIKAGAAGYVLKDAPENQLTTAVRKVIDGETTFNRRLATQLLQRLANEVQGPSDAQPNSRRVEVLQPLTPRELEVLELVALGLTNREIAQRFVLGVGTVKNHVEHIIAKLGVSDRTQAVVRALEAGLIEFPDHEADQQTPRTHVKTRRYGT
jgi:DNA-binding NarL/FixJ family response regulator